MFFAYSDPDPVHHVVCDPDHVPVCDQPHEAGLPGGEQPTAPPSFFPEGETGQEKHSTMKNIVCQPQLRLFLPVQHRDVFMYIVYLASLFVHCLCLPQSLFATLSLRTTRAQQ